MQYYRLIQDREISNPILIEKLNRDDYADKASWKQYSQAPGMAVAYFTNSPETEKPDVLYDPVFLVSDRFKRLLRLYLPKLPLKGIQCYPKDVEDNEAPLYWWPYLKEADCLDASTEKYPSGALKHLVLDESCVEGQQIFLAGGLLETEVIVSMELAESMLRRCLWGMELIPADSVKGNTIWFK